MSHQGFPKTEDPIWAKRLSRLTDVELEFYSTGLPNILRVVCISIVNKRSIPYILDRLSVHHVDLWNGLLELVESVVGEEEFSGYDDIDIGLYLRRYTGFYMLFRTLDNTEYSQLISTRLKSMSKATHTRILNWGISEVSSEIQALERSLNAG